MIPTETKKNNLNETFNPWQTTSTNVNIRKDMFCMMNKLTFPNERDGRC